ncbi:MAG: DUF2789 family protein [Gammaproteobacteria bacterium]|nr:DUF2789 family protein [Gammaproteobacteria bacterium]
MHIHDRYPARGQAPEIFAIRLKQVIDEDADWAEIVDQLDAMLR